MRLQIRVNILGQWIWRCVPCLIAITTCFVWTYAAAQEHAAPVRELIANASDALSQGNTPRALELYQQAVELEPTWPDGWWYVGSIQYGSNNYPSAVVALSRYIEMTPTAGPAFALRGLSEFEEGKYPESLQDLQRGIELGAANQPRNAGIILYHEAILLTETGSFEQALGKYTEMVKHGDINPDVLAGIGLAGLRLPILPKDIDPSQMETVSAAGQAASVFMAGDPAAADRAFQRLFDRCPTTANLHYLYGYLLFTVDSGKAIDQFTKELTVSPDSALTHAMLAWAYGSRDDYAASLPEAKRAVDDGPTLLIAQLVLGRALLETGDMKNAVEHLLLVTAADPQNLDAHLTLAKAYSKLGRREDARQERLQCLAITAPRAIANAKM